MLAVVKRPRTKLPDLELKGKIPGWIIVRLKKEHGKCFRVLDENKGEEELVDIRETAWFKKMKKDYKPGDSIKVYRDNFGYSQEKLGKLLGGIPRQNISAMEKNRRGISKKIALKLSEIFDVPVERFIV